MCPRAERREKDGMLNLIIGGAGSGKSAFAEALVRKLPGQRVYLATMEARDEESLARIRRHREQRAGHGFVTVECGHALGQLRVPEGANVLLEDLSNLLANERFGPEGGGTAAVRHGLDSLRTHCGQLTVVTNEVFSDGCDYAEETLAFMRELAALNRELAAEAGLVVEVVCGLPNVLKGELP